MSSSSPTGDRSGPDQPPFSITAAPTPTLPGLTSGDDEWRPRKGDLLGRYVILQPIGRGGMGAVYAAYDPELDRKVAIKILLAGLAREGPHAEAHRLLRREAKALARLNHPNVLAVFDVGEMEGRVFIATELVDGQNLHRWLGSQRTRRQVLRTFLAAGKGLAAAHGEGIVHRDFKPGNVMIDGKGRVRVVDFGLARVATIDGSHRASFAGGAAPPKQVEGLSALHGTPAYMAPEQHAGQAATARSDQYSFCLTLFEALYGPRSPGPGVNSPGGPVEIPARSPAGRVPVHLRRALHRGLAARAEDRFDSMDELLSALGARGWSARWPYLAVAATATVTALATFFLQPGPTPCESSTDKLASVWTPGRRGNIASTVGAEGTVFAREASRTVVEAIDAYGATWVDMHRDTCLATHATGEQSEEMLDLRMTCLDRRLAELDALATLLTEPEAVRPEHAVRAARGLVPLGRCTDVRALRARQPLPEAAADRDHIRRLESRLASARAERAAGRFSNGLDLAEKVVADAAKAKYWPLTAESLLLMGRLQTNLNRAEEAAGTLEQAFYAAVAGNDHRTATEAAVQLVRVTGYQLADLERGQYFADLARPMLDQLSAPAELAGMLDDYVGILFFQQDDYPRALEHHQRALASKRQASGAESPEVADTLTRLGNVASAQGQHADALDYFEQALAIHQAALGPNHPRTATSHDRVGTAHFNLADWGKSDAAHRLALEIRQAVFGPEDSRVASSLMHLGNVAIAQGHFAQSLELFTLAHEIFVAHDEAHPNVARALANKGIALHWLRRFDEAIDHYQAARQIQCQLHGEDHTSVASTDFNLGEAWLEKGEDGAALEFFHAARATWEEKHGAEHYALGDALTGAGRALINLERASEAIPLLERALAIRVRAELDPIRLATTRFALVRALWANGQFDDRARALAAQARKELAGSPERNRDILTEIVDWLSAHDEP